MENSRDIEQGWVVASMEGTFVLSFTFSRTRSDSIKSFIKLWDPKRDNWRKFKRQGYKCVKATQTTEIDNLIGYLTKKQAAARYGKRVKYDWLNMYTGYWEGRKGTINGTFLTEMEQGRIKDVTIQL